MYVTGRCKYIVNQEHKQIWGTRKNNRNRNRVHILHMMNVMVDPWTIRIFVHIHYATRSNTVAIHGSQSHHAEAIGGQPPATSMRWLHKCAAPPPTASISLRLLLPRTAAAPNTGVPWWRSLMHVKCIHELCIIILIFQSYMHHIRVTSWFYNDFRNISQFSYFCRGA